MDSLPTVLDTALDLEKRAQEFYRKSAEQVNDPVVASVLTSLADDEEAHITIIRRYYEAVERGQGWHQAKNDLPDSGAAGAAVEKLIKDSLGSINADPTFVHVYRSARDLEQNSRNFYESQCEKTESFDAKAFFRFLSELEQAHLKALEVFLDAAKLR